MKFNRHSVEVRDAGTQFNGLRKIAAEHKEKTGKVPDAVKRAIENKARTINGG